VSTRRVLFAERGTELRIGPLLEGIRTLSGEKIQWYLASELRDRIRNAKVRVTVIDKLARKQYEVEPRAYEGRLLHQLPPVRTPFGEHSPWSSRYLQGLIDVPFLNLTPGTRSGVIHDERYAALLEALQPLQMYVNGLIEEQQRAEEEQASQQSLRAIQRAFREALLALPPEEYDWFDVQARARNASGAARPGASDVILVNSGHRDFVFATRNRALQLRYLVRLYVKELVLRNFAGVSAEQLLERMVELSLYAEEKLKTG